MSGAIELQIEPRERRVGQGSVQRLLPFHQRRMVGPFIFADLIGPEVLAPGSATSIDAHPHIGLSTVTYLFDGRMVHRDSTGAVATVEPGALNWMTAGSGVAHTERSHPDDVGRSRGLHGLQTWVALPDEREETDAAFAHVDRDEVPTETVGNSFVRVAAGDGWGVSSPVSGSSPLILAEVRVSDGHPVPVVAALAELAVIAVSGTVRVNDQQLPVGHLATLAPMAVTLSGDGTAMVLGGEPVGVRHIWWNFVHSDRERIEQAKADWSAQRFAPVPGDHEPWIPLPGPAQ